MYIMHLVSIGRSGGMLPQENFVNARGSLLRPFLGPKSHILANRILIVATCTLCKLIVIADCA